MDHPTYDILFSVSILAAITSGAYFRKQTLMLKKELGMAEHEAANKAKTVETMQNRVNDEIMGYPAAPGILSKMGLTERVFLLDQKADTLDKKTDLQNIVINGAAEAVKQLLPNGGTSLADKINRMNVILIDNSERLIDHLEASDVTKRDLSDRITHIETILSKEGNHDKV